MRKRLLTALSVVTLLAAATWSGVSYAWSYYYRVTFYSDPGMTLRVGEYQQYCQDNLYIITPLVTGETSPYYTETPIGVCPGLGDW